MRATGRTSVPSRRETWLVAVLVLALLGWFAVAVHSTTAVPEPLRSTAGSFVPADGSRQPVSVTQRGATTRAMMESARIEGGGITFAMSPAALAEVELPTRGLSSTSWWREAVVPSTATSPARYRIRSIDEAGVWLRVQDWEELGISFAHFLELPADVAAGQTWSSSGAALAEPTTRPLTYRNISRATEPADRDRAGLGCLHVDSTTELTGGGKTETWREVNVWCPALGVVEERGDFRGSTYAVVPTTTAEVSSADLRARPLEVTGLDGWRVRTEELFAGDPTFGGDTAAVFTAMPPVVAANGVVSFPQAEGRDLSGLVPFGPGRLWAHWWARPGGDVVTLASIGSLVLVTTTDRRLTAYQAGGDFRWSAPLDDVAVVAPVSVAGTSVAVATVSGEVALFDAATGRRLWRDQLDHGVHQALATDGSVLVAADAGPTLTAWDVDSGRQRWQSGVGSAFTTGLLVGRDEVVLASNGSLSAYDLADGDRRWNRPVGLGLASVSSRFGQLWVDVDGALQSRSFQTGGVVWTLPEGVGAAPACVGGPGAEPTAFAFRGTDLVAVDPRGRVQRSWALGGRATDVRSAGCADGRVWVSSYDAGNGSLRVESIGKP